MKFICNGQFFDEADAIFGKLNRAFLFGDYISEFYRITDSNIQLSEEHYFNLMASMRIYRMSIPLAFTQEFFENEIQKLSKENSISNGKIKVSIYRNADSEHDLTRSSISYCIEIVKEFPNSKFLWRNEWAEIDIFKDFTVNSSFFTQVNSHKPEEIIALAFMQENGFQDLVLVNSEKRIARTLLGVPFLVQGNLVKTPKIAEGGIRSVTRNHLIQFLTKHPDFILEETEIFPFELQKTDELFICLESEGIVSIHQNRKKNYTTQITEKIWEEWNKSFD